MQLAPPKFHALVQAIAPGELGKEDAAALVGIARLAVDADAHEDRDELAAYDVVAGEVCKLAGLDVNDIEQREALKRRGADDRAQRMQAYAHALSTASVKELAYACANVVIVADLALQPSESEFLGELQAALDMDDSREAVVAQHVNDALQA